LPAPNAAQVFHQGPGDSPRQHGYAILPPLAVSHAGMSTSFTRNSAHSMMRSPAPYISHNRSTQSAERVDLVPAQHDRYARRPPRWYQVGEPVERDAQHDLIKEDGRAQRLVLRRRTDVAGSCQRLKAQPRTDEGR